MTSPSFGRKEAREVAARRARRSTAIRHAIAAGSTGVALLLGSAGTYFAGPSGLSVLLAIAAVGSFIIAFEIAREA